VSFKSAKYEIDKMSNNLEENIEWYEKEPYVEDFIELKKVDFVVKPRERVFELYGLSNLPIYGIECKNEPFQFGLANRIMVDEPVHLFSAQEFLKTEHKYQYDFMIKRDNEESRMCKYMMEKFDPLWSQKCIDYINQGVPAVIFGNNNRTRDIVITVTVVAVYYKNEYGNKFLRFSS
jgi:hypothetical protein